MDEGSVYVIFEIIYMLALLTKSGVGRSWYARARC